MKENYTIAEVMEMHTYFANKVMNEIDSSKRFIHNQETKEIICEKRGFFGWKRKTGETYQEVLFNDFNISKERI